MRNSRQACAERVRCHLHEEDEGYREEALDAAQGRGGQVPVKVVPGVRRELQQRALRLVHHRLLLAQPRPVVRARPKPPHCLHPSIYPCMKHEQLTTCQTCRQKKKTSRKPAIQKQAGRHAGEDANDCQMTWLGLHECVTLMSAMSIAGARSAMSCVPLLGQCVQQ